MGELNENEIKTILERAGQIQIESNTDIESETAALLKAAEEAGLSRQAVELALQERLSSQQLPCTKGDLIFAPRPDGSLHVAQVIESLGSVVRARFFNGAEVTIPRDQAIKADFQVGAKVQAYWPVHNWHTSTVIGFERENETVKLSDGWGFTKTFSLSEIRLRRKKILASSFAQFWQNNYTYILAAIGLTIVAILLVKL